MSHGSNQDVYWWRGSNKGRLTAIRATVLAQRDGKVQILLNDGGTRWVDVERVQTIRRWCHSWPVADHVHFEFPVNEWGPCTIHSEINEDLFPNRCVYEFQAGKYLRYDRSHWFDKYGSLGTLAYCHFRWREFWSKATEISSHEFEELWKRAGLPNEDVCLLHREIPSELAETKPWMRTPVQIGK